MPELHDLLVDAVRTQPAVTPPPLEGLVRKVRRRRQVAVVAAIVTTSVAVVLPVTLIGSNHDGGSMPRHRNHVSPRPTTPPPKADSYPLCRRSQVTVSATPSIAQPLTSTRISAVWVVNASSKPCTLTGRPRLTFSNTAHDHLTINYSNDIDGERVPSHAAPVVIAPSEHANVYIQTISTAATPNYHDCGYTGNPLWSITLRTGQQPIAIGRYDLPACIGTEVTITSYVPAHRAARGHH